jgi:hypothetical protein
MALQVQYRLAVLFVLSVIFFTINNIVVAALPHESHLVHEPQQQQRQVLQSVPSEENGTSRSKQSSYINRELLPWYVDFWTLPSDGKSLLL